LFKFKRWQLSLRLTTPLLATWQACEAAALDAATGDRTAAMTRLRDIATRAPGRFWIERTLAQ
jgi:hypothetical protein